MEIKYDATLENDKRVVRASLKCGPLLAVGRPGSPITAIAYGTSGSERMIAAMQEIDGKPLVTVTILTQKRSLAGAGKFTVSGSHDVTPLLEGRPVRILVNGRADSLVAINGSGTVQYIFRKPDGMEVWQTIKPFEDGSIATADFLFGDDSLVFTSAKGENVIYSLYSQGSRNQRLFGMTKTLDKLPGAGTAYSASLRNKAFLVASDRFASLRFGTSASVRWESALAFNPQLAVIGGKYESLLLLGDDQKLHLYDLDDPHPEAGFRAFFGKIWYEGSPEPKYEWQSSGASDDFEPKLSMVPLIIGTLKGTLYAMIFSVPLALLAALYTSQFAHPDLKKFIKPVMEIMASLPSVILGFLAALWMAPLMETRVPSFLLLIVFLPLSAIAFGWLWSNLPFEIRKRIRPGYEFFAILPVIILTGYAAWELGPWLEGLLFVGRDLATGQPIADFRLWWTQVVELPFEQRNSLVVGFMMGFAVIPIIFTIAEDALSNVPPAFRSASLALGASRWQTAMRVILPTASAGIFSAIMIGFGRAVGETMIVLMATGNTPIMDFNIFSGMRTLSANIAVELPEAPHHGTLFRALYLGALLLFLMTFVVNTLAEILRHHLREKFKAV